MRREFMKAKSFIAILCVLSVVFAITGCGSEDGGGGVSVAVDTSIHTINDPLLAPSLSGTYPSGGDTEVVNFIQRARSARESYYRDLPGNARAAGAEDDNTYVSGYSYDNYKVPGKRIYIQGYSNYTGTQSYRDEDDAVTGDTETESGNNSWATTYDRESFTQSSNSYPYSGVTYEISGKVFSSESWSFSTNYTYVNDAKTLFQGTWSGSDSWSEKEAFSISDGTYSLKYIFEISNSYSGSEDFVEGEDAPPDDEEDEEDDWPLYPDDADYAEYWDKYLSSYNVTLTVYDRNGRPMIGPITPSNPANKRWIIEHLGDYLFD
jgi:hypothetical protein